MSGMNINEDLSNAFRENSEKPRQTAEEQAQALLRNFPLCFLTGTRAYGPVTGKSDWDVACPIWLEVELTGVLRSFPQDMFGKGSKEYPGRSAKQTAPDGVQLNLIFLTPIEYVCWRTATEMMKLLPVPQDHRILRYAEFEALRAMVKSRISDTPWIHRIKGVEHLFLGKPLDNPGPL